MSVEDCRRSLPIKISRRSLAQIIRSAGPEFYQEWHRQIFVTAEQWAVIATGIKPPCSRSGDAGRKAAFKSSARSAESASGKKLALYSSRTPRRSASSPGSGYLMKQLLDSVQLLDSQTEAN
jgi:hypothetical protein